MRGTSTTESKRECVGGIFSRQPFFIDVSFAVPRSCSDVVCSGVQCFDVETFFDSTYVWDFVFVLFGKYCVVATRPCAPPLT